MEKQDRTVKSELEFAGEMHVAMTRDPSRRITLILTPTELVADDALTPAQANAFEAYCKATRIADSPLTDAEAFAIVRDHQIYEANQSVCPSLQTFKRHLVDARGKRGQNKNTPRAGRGYGRSVVNADHI